jgi:hypothetical protein
LAHSSPSSATQDTQFVMSRFEERARSLTPRSSRSNGPAASQRQRARALLLMFSSRRRCVRHISRCEGRGYRVWGLGSRVYDLKQMCLYTSKLNLALRITALQQRICRIAVEPSSQGVPVWQGRELRTRGSFQALRIYGNKHERFSSLMSPSV